MTWLTWRQYRVQGALVLAALLALAVVLVLTGLHLVHVYDQCRATGDCAASHFGTQDNGLQLALSALLLVVPAVIGMFWGAPLVAQELETGTNKLGWTQTVSRRRWLGVKLGLLGLCAMALAGLLSLGITWWFSPIDKVLAARFGGTEFGLRGIVPVGYAAFAFALGVTLGVLIRRTLPAMAATLVAYVAARVVFTEWIRPRLLAPAHTTVPVGAGNIAIGVNPAGADLISTTHVVLPNAWVYSATLVDQAGHGPTSKFLAQACPDIGSGLTRLGIPHHLGQGTAVVGPTVPGPFQACAAKVAADFHQAVTYQPANRYWDFQAIEAALFIVLALALCGLTFWWVRHRLS
jgi:hypothetical protein